MTWPTSMSSTCFISSRPDEPAPAQRDRPTRADSRGEIPFGIPGCSYATAPFTHVNPSGSRFSDGSYGVLYLADSMETALAEVRHHQELYWSGVVGLNFERFVFRGLSCQFDEAGLLDATTVALSDPIYDPNDYSAARQFGRQLRQDGFAGLRLPLGAQAWPALLGAHDAAQCALHCPDRPLRDDLERRHYQCQRHQRGFAVARPPPLVRTRVTANQL